jgi:hypothetical protein
LGPENPRFASSLSNLARLYYQWGRYKDAEPLLRQSVSIEEKVLGPDHPSLAYSLKSYALVLRKTKQKSEAAALEARAEAMLAKCAPHCETPNTVDIRALRPIRNNRQQPTYK